MFVYLPITGKCPPDLERDYILILHFQSRQ
jgi:hypothetical protein